MKLIYGRGDCELQYPEENIKSVVIRYKGNVILKHNHLELIEALSETTARCLNVGSQSLLIHANNQIHIGFRNQSGGNILLFKYSGDFKILNVNVNNNNIPFTVNGIDNCDLIDSTFDVMEKPEFYRKGYISGKITRRKKINFAKIEKLITANKLENVKFFKTDSRGGIKRATTDWDFPTR